MSYYRQSRHYWQHGNLITSENESMFVPIGTKHGEENPDTMTFEMTQEQSGSNPGGDEIVRLNTE